MAEALRPGDQSGSPKKLDGAAKAAVLLLAMSKPSASKLLKHFSEDEVRAVARYASHLEPVPQATLESLVQEFAVGLGLEKVVRGSFEDVEAMLSGVIPAEQVRQIMSEVRSRASNAVWPRLSEIAPGPLSQFLSKEHPQVVAFVLSKTTPAAAAAVIGLLPQSLRNEVMRRMLGASLVLEPPLRLLEAVIREEILQKLSRASGPNIHARVADIINKMDRREIDEVLDNLNAHKPKDARVVKGLLFTFEDIGGLSDSGRQALFASVPPEQIILALTNADPVLKDQILAVVPARTKRMIEQELTMGGGAPQKDIQKMRRAIADLALDMAERGQLEIRPAGENDA
jgi:flagellar motor switch protein FliG